MFGWLWTTAIALWNLLEEWQQARGAATLGEYFGDWINLFDQACVWTQVRAVRVSACGGSVHRWFSARTS